MQPHKFQPARHNYCTALAGGNDNLRALEPHAGLLGDPGGSGQLHESDERAVPMPFLRPDRFDFQTNDPESMTNKKRIYISGPMTGMPGKNVRAFNAEAERLRALGHFVINPAELDLDEGATWIDYMRADLIQMLDACTSIHLLPGWEKSAGATLEHHVARALGYEITFAEGA